MKNKNLFVTTTKEIVYQNKWSSVTKTNIENENLKKEIFTTNFGKRSAVIVYADEKVLLTKQYRLLIDIFLGKFQEEELKIMNRLKRLHQENVRKKQVTGVYLSRP